MVGMGSEDGMGEASGWVRCAEKSFCRVFSVFS
jgi:hypothetical protein